MIALLCTMTYPGMVGNVEDMILDVFAGDDTVKVSPLYFPDGILIHLCLPSKVTIIVSPGFLFCGTVNSSLASLGSNSGMATPEIGGANAP